MKALSFKSLLLCLSLLFPLCMEGIGIKRCNSCRPNACHHTTKARPPAGIRHHTASKEPLSILGALYLLGILGYMGYRLINPHDE